MLWKRKTNTAKAMEFPAGCAGGDTSGQRGDTAPDHQLQLSEWLSMEGFPWIMLAPDTVVFPHYEI